MVQGTYADRVKVSIGLMHNLTEDLMLHILSEERLVILDKVVRVRLWKKRARSKRVNGVRKAWFEGSKQDLYTDI
jgi:hypothetical protein